MMKTNASSHFKNSASKSVRFTKSGGWVPPLFFSRSFHFISSNTNVLSLDILPFSFFDKHLTLPFDCSLKSYTWIYFYLSHVPRINAQLFPRLKKKIYIYILLINIFIIMKLSRERIDMQALSCSNILLLCLWNRL